MTTQRFWFTYALLIVFQAIVCNYVNFTPMVTMTILPALIMCIPVGVSTSLTMFIAFLTGFFVDLAADAVLGLNVLALVPVALCRNSILRLVFGRESFGRKDVFSFKTKGGGKISAALFFATAIFLAIYIAADGAGVRTLSFNISRFVSSLTLSLLFAMVTVKLMAPEDKLN